MDLMFEDPKIQKWNILTDRAQRVDGKKSYHFSGYHVHSPSYGH